MPRPPAESSGFEFQISKTENRFAWDSKKVEQLIIALDENK